MKRNTAQLKEKLIQTGVETITKQGIDQLSLRKVAKLCGVTHGTPYKHFDSKEGYLKVVLNRLAEINNQNMIQGIDVEKPAREQLITMGYNYVTFAKSYPYIFEALFIKYPFNYLEIRQGSLQTNHDLVAFNNYKKVVVKLRQEEGFTSNEAENLFHFWSYISGLAILINSPVGSQLDQAAIKGNIESMLNIYIKGEQS